MRSISAGCLCSLLVITLCISSVEAKVNFSHKLPDLAASPPENPGPQAIAVADLNNDRRADIIAVDTGHNEVIVFTNDGTGGFGAGELFNTGVGPVAVSVGDFNHDGRPDIVTANKGANTVSILLALSTGGFGAPMDFAGGSSPIGVVVARLDSDQNQDLAVLNLASVYLLKGDGNGGFTPFNPSSVSTDGSTAFAIAAGQFNSSSDNFVDLAVSDQDTGDVFVLLGNGDGTFGASTSVFNQGNLPQGIAVADFNNDNNQDIAVVTRSFLNGTGDTDVHLFIAYGDGTGTFQDPPDEAPQPETDSMVLAAADLDSDGQVDASVGNPGQTIGVSVFCNHVIHASMVCVDNNPLAVTSDGFQLQSPIGSLGGGTSAIQAAYPCGPSPQVGCGDLNGDGLPDLVDLSATGDAVRVFINISSAQATPTITPTISGSVSPTATGSTATPTGPTPTSTATPPPVVTATPSAIPVPYTECRTTVGGLPVAVAVERFVTGASPQIAVADGQQNKIFLIPSNLNSTGSTACAVLGLGSPTAVADVRSPTGLLAYDFDKNGKPDLAVVGADGVKVLFGDGTGQFPVQRQLQTAQIPRSIAVADFNRDRIPDIIVADGTSTVSLFLGTGQDFQPACPISAGSLATLIVANDPDGTDLNADGWPDFAVGSDQNNFLSVFLRKPPPATPVPTPGCLTASDFQALSALNLTARPTALVVGQLEPPGDNNLPDFAVAQTNGSVFLYLGKPAPTPGVMYDAAPMLSVPAPPKPIGSPMLSSIGSGDVNGDRRADLVVADEKNNDIVVFLATLDGNFAATAPIPVGSQPVGLWVGDIDGDLRADAVTANSGGTISVLITSRPPPTPLPPSPTATGTPTATFTPTATETPPNTPTGTVTPTGTRTLAPTVTPTTVPTSTPRGVITLGSCALDSAPTRLDENLLLVWAVAGGWTAWRRRALRHLKLDSSTSHET